jgi:GDP-L-galactose phosphorylase
VDSIVSEKKGVDVFEDDKGEPPVAFLDSLLLGEV